MHATATAGPVLNGLVQFGFRSFFSPMDRTFKHYLNGHNAKIFPNLRCDNDVTGREDSDNVLGHASIFMN